LVWELASIGCQLEEECLHPDMAFRNLQGHPASLENLKNIAEHDCTFVTPDHVSQLHEQAKRYAWSVLIPVASFRSSKTGNKLSIRAGRNAPREVKHGDQIHGSVFVRMGSGYGYKPRAKLGGGKWQRMAREYAPPVAQIVHNVSL
jgi:hypothetical protein